MSKAAERVLDVLYAIGVADTPQGVMELAATTGLNKSTCSRLVRLLESHEYVIKDQASRKYRIGPTTLGLLATVSKRSELLRVVHPYLEMIRSESGETTSFHLRVGDERLCIDAVDRVPAQIMIQPLGIRNPLYVGTSGRVLLANANSKVIERLTEQALLAGHDPDTLRADLDRARVDGFLLSVSYKDSRHVTLSAPLFGDSTAFGCVTVTAPKDRWNQDDARGYADRLLEHAATISSVVTHGRIFIPTTLEDF